MLDVAGQEKALLALANDDFLADVRLLSQSQLSELRHRSITCAIEADTTFAGKPVRLRVGVDGRFPLSLPAIFLVPADAMGFIPHVEVDGDGYVCFAQTEGLLLDAANPVGILRESLARAIAVLSGGVSGENRADFTDELAAYWHRVALKVPISSFLHVDSVPREVVAYRAGQNFVLVADRDDDVRSYYNGENWKHKPTARHSALYVPLITSPQVPPPRRGRLWTIEQIRGIVRTSLPEQAYGEVERLCKRHRSEELVILGVPRPSGGVILVGLLFRDVNGGHPLLAGRAQDPPVPLEIHRYDIAYLLPRGGGRIDLHKRRVLVAGCGAVGGHIVLALARTGIGHLTLVDPDVMTPEITFRHVLGNSAIDRPKVEALRKEIAAKYPYVTVAVHQQRIEESFAAGRVKPNDFDLIILATGNSTVELYLNELLYKSDGAPPMVFAWLEPYGIGGHVLLALPGRPGCLRCLYTPYWKGESSLANRAAFAAPGQVFGKDDLGCGSLYTPYGALDAERTADQAVSLSLEALLGQEPSSPLLSWKGLPMHFLAAGFQLSPRYQMGVQELHDTRFEYINPLCPVCAER
ncbi:MAG: hypothetical protein EPO21_23045 [Chloroflexota bacterium]|nr:MAG: hypothetical protein EPO21_23045 [Chloroflexota bacterium]